MAKQVQHEAEPIIPSADSMQLVDRSAVEAMERAQIDMQISTAQRYKKHAPNMLSKVKDDMRAFALLDEDTAASCFYSLPRGGKNIQGPSVRMAEIALTCYGNARVAARIMEINTVGDTPNVVIQAMSHDLENNVAFTAEKRRRITKKKNKNTIDEDDINLAVNACTAIAFRDATFKMIPMALIKPVVEEAKKVAVGNLKSLVAKRTQVLNRLQQMGATEKNILHVVDCRKIEDIALDHLEQLIGLGTALKEGNTTLEEAFPNFEEQQADAQGRNKKDSASVKTGDVFNEERPPLKEPEGEAFLEG